MNMQTFIGRSEARTLGMASVVSVLVRGVGTAATLGYTLLMSRTMSPADVGTVWSIWSVTFVVATMVTLNIGGAAVRDIVAARALGRDEIAAGFVVASRRLLTITAPVVCVGFLVVAYAHDPQSVHDNLYGYIAATLSIPVLGWIQTNASHAAALHRALLSQVARSLIRPLLFLSAFAIIWALSYQPSVNFTLGLYFLAVCLAAFVQFALLRRSFSFMREVQPDTSPWRQWVGAGLAVAPMLLLAEYLKSVVILFCGLALHAAEVGTVAIALSIIGFLNFGMTAVDSQFAPRISGALARRNGVRAARLQAYANVLKFLPALVAAAVLFVAAEWILGLFGAHYAAGADATAWFLLIPLSRATFGNATLVLQVGGHRGDILWTTLVGLGLMAAGAYAGGLNWGLTGAAAGCSVAYAALKALRYLSCRARTGMDTSIFGTPAALLRPIPVTEI